LEDLRSAISPFIMESNWEQFHSPKNLAMALSVEVAEIVKHFKWLINLIVGVSQLICVLVFLITRLMGGGHPVRTENDPLQPVSTSQRPHSACITVTVSRLAQILAALFRVPSTAHENEGRAVLCWSALALAGLKEKR
jgi:hypothetical protein